MYSSIFSGSMIPELRSTILTCRLKNATSLITATERSVPGAWLHQPVDYPALDQVLGHDLVDVLDV